jgi:signal transduction histidine kinase
VDDDGPGVAEAERERVFERFYQVDPTSAAGGGAGLGLSMVRTIATLHHGAATLAVSPLGGARFTATFETQIG